MFTLRRGPFFIFFSVILLLLSIKGYGSDSTGVFRKKNIAFATFAGKENFGSVNYDRIFSTRKKLIWSYSIGVQPFELSKRFSLPFSINVFTNGLAHHFEVNVVATFFMNKYHPYDGGWKDDFNKQLYLSPFACYSFKKLRGLFLKQGWDHKFYLTAIHQYFTI